MAKAVAAKPASKLTAKTPANAADEVSRGIVALLLKEPFYGHLLSGVVRRIDDKVPTAAVSLTPHGLHLIVNPEFFMKELKKDERVAVIKHEALHLLFRHLYRPLIQNGDAKLFNIAADLVVNQHVAPWPLPEMAVTLRAFPDMDLEVNQTLEWYYEKLKSLHNSMQWGKSSGSPLSEEALQRVMGEQQQGDHSFWYAGGGEDFGGSGPEGFGGGSVLSEGLRKAMEADLERHLLRARDHSASKGWGNLPAEIRTELETIAQRRKPKIDWKRSLRLFASSGYRTEVVATNRRMSKRFGTFPGIRIRRKQRLAAVIDTSGSINDDVLEIFFREIHGIWKNDAEVMVVECDADVKRAYEYKGKTPKAVEGGGGTCFDPALTWVSNPLHGPFDACIYLTDGCAGEPAVRPRCPLLWVITAGGNIGTHLKFGRVIQLPGD
jgi:predicted metal-dependent peptidase